jgi:hypothetical protein
MTDQWAACFPQSSLQSALHLRVRSDVKACQEGEIIWLTGAGSFEEIDPLLRRVPKMIRYTVQADNTITRMGWRIPERKLPAANWSAFSAIAELHPQPAALPAGARTTVPIQIVRSAHSEEPSAMLCPIQFWVDYAMTAPGVRLKPLHFAVREDGQTLILGSPLPPLRGLYLIDRAGLLLPGGYCWAPRLEAQIIRRSMNLATNDFALFNLDGSYELIPAENIIAASRSAARRSFASFTGTAGAV